MEKWKMARFVPTHVELMYSSSSYLPTLPMQDKQFQNIVMPAHPKNSKDATWELINVIVISIVYTLAYITFFSLQNLQSSLNPTSGLGVLSLSLMYVMCFISSYFSPLFINGIGVKSTILLAWSFLCIYTIANFFPTWETLLPTSLLFGFMINPVWSSQATYVTRRAMNYAYMTGKKSAKILGKFNSMFYSMFNCSLVVGNLVSSLILNQSHATHHPINVTSFSVIDAGSPTYGVCGANDCPASVDKLAHNQTLPVVQETNRDIINILLGVFCGLTVSSLVITAVFLKPLDRTERLPFRAVLKSCVCLPFKDRKLLMLLPFSTAMTFFAALICAEFTKSYVTCSLGLGMVGYILATHGGVSAIVAFLHGYFVKYTGRITTVILCVMLQVSVLLTMLLWYPRSDELYVFYLVAVLAGIAEGTLPTQTTTLYAIVFHDQLDQAFSNMNGAKSLGYMLMFAVSSLLCTSTKLIISIILLVFGVILFTITDVLHAQKALVTDGRDKTVSVIDVLSDDDVNDVILRKSKSVFQIAAEEKLISS